MLTMERRPPRDRLTPNAASLPVVVAFRPGEDLGESARDAAFNLEREWERFREVINAGGYSNA